MKQRMSSMFWKLARAVTGGLRRLAATPGSAGPQPSLHAEKLDYHSTYNRHVGHLKQSQGDQKRAMELAIGGEFRAFGILERELLVMHGLQESDYVIDVGCGSGRLSSQLAEKLKGRYLGTDVVDDLLQHAASITGRPDWRFVASSGLAIPENDGCANFVCFFSVFTHLLHEESFTYLKEARRVLVPGGKVVFSFLEFQIPSHWAVFEQNVSNIGRNTHLNQFMSRDGIERWATHLGLSVEAIHDGDKPYIPVPEPLILDDGRVIEGKGTLGQSVCVLTKPRS